jgi:hypothetical protein
MNGSAIGLMSTKRISVERVSIISRKSLQNVLAKFDAAIDSAECVAPFERMSEGLKMKYQKCRAYGFALLLKLHSPPP